MCFDAGGGTYPYKIGCDLRTGKAYLPTPRVQKPSRLEDFLLVVGRHGGLTVSALVSGSSGLGSSPGRGHCVVFLGKTLYSHSASLHPGVQMGTGEFNAGG